MITLKKLRNQKKQLQNKIAARRRTHRRLPQLEQLELRHLLTAGFIQGTAFDDANSDGTLDANESYLAGVSFGLRDTANNVLQSTLTDASGSYRFENLTAGESYIVTNDGKPGFSPTGASALSQINPAAVITSSSILVVVADPEQLTTTFNLAAFNNLARNQSVFGSVKIYGASVTGRAGQLPVSITSGDPLYATSFLTYCTNLFQELEAGNNIYEVDPIFDPPFTNSIPTYNGDRIAYLYNHYGTTLASNRAHAFALQVAIWELEYDITPDLHSGNLTYNEIVGTTAPESLVQFYINDSAGKSENVIFLDALSPPIQGGLQGILATGTLNFGMQGVPTAELSGIKFHDLDASGAQDNGEPGLEGFVIFLDSNGNQQLDGNELSDASDVNGFYHITGITPGTYDVLEVSQNGWIESLGTYDGTTFTSGQSITSGYDFGNYQNGSLSGVKFHDLNANGINDSDPGLGGFKIFLDADGDQILDGDELFAVTEPDGSYFITGIKPGTYDVLELNQAGYIQSLGTYNGTTFTSGQVITDKDFGNYQNASLSGVKFHDLNANGFNDSEPGFAGFTIFLDKDGDKALDGDEYSDITEADGSYSITGITPGTYDVLEVNQAGYVQSLGTYNGTTFTSGQSIISGKDFGNYQNGSLSGVKFEDMDADGVKDAGEPGVPNFVIFLDADGDKVKDPGELSAMTDSNGNYAITGIKPGTYDVLEVSQSGWVQSLGTYNGTTFISAQSIANKNFGNYRFGSLSGQKFDDLDADGIKDAGEPGVPNFVIFLDADGDKAKDADELSATTDSSGNYTITGIKPGTYDVLEVAETGWIQSLGTYNGTTFVSNQIISSKDFGNYRLGKIQGTKYIDVTGNGITSDDVPWGGTTIYIDKDNSSTLNAGDISTTSASDGTFSFPDLKPGTYIVREVVPAGYVQKAPVSPNYYTVVVKSGELKGGYDFANFHKLSDISGEVFCDANNDGLEDVCDEAGIAGVQIKITGTDDLGNPVSITTTTASDGTYSFVGLRPSKTGTTYKIEEVSQPAGYFDGKETIGSLGGTKTNDAFFLELGAGLVGTGYNFAELGENSLSGYVYLDADDDGVKDANEVGIEGVKITLTGKDNLGASVSLTTYTDSTGKYTFTKLRPSNSSGYTIKETQPVGTTDGKDTLGSAGGTKPANDTFLTYLTKACIKGVNYNFGEKGQGVRTGDTGTIGFWRNNNGQALIKSLNGSQNAKNLGNWLASNFPKLFGSSAPSADNLSGKTNLQVAAYFALIFDRDAPKTECQILATALATYATSSTLAGGTYAAKYGFTVTTSGFGGKLYNVTTNGGALGYANYSLVSVLNLLKKANSIAVGGRIYPTNITLESQVNNIFSGINEEGDIV